MIHHGRQYSTTQPQPVTVNMNTVFIASEITSREVSEDAPGLDEIRTYTVFEFDLDEYNTEEYIRIIRERNADLEQETTNLQLALCDVYEML